LLTDRTPRGLVTQNSRKSVGVVLTRLALWFDTVITREDVAPKPVPEPVWLACRQMGLSPAELLFAGDLEFDMLAGRRAGVRTVLLRNPESASFENADLVVDSLAELYGWLASGG
jgi:phosphoglycolate phosphatase-like HAD superfamily hydrolase